MTQSKAALVAAALLPLMAAVAPANAKLSTGFAAVWELRMQREKSPALAGLFLCRRGHSTTATLQLDWWPHGPSHLATTPLMACVPK
jgi:hypothetical protein